MRKSPLFVAVLITMIMTASLVTAGTPEGVEPGVWAKVEAQLEAQGLHPAGAKADRDVAVEVAKLFPTQDITGEEAYFGQAIAVDGDFMVVGASDEEVYIRAGAAFIFQRNEGGADAWGQVAKLTASDKAPGDEFGVSVSISGDTVAVGAFGDNDDGYDSGSAYIFGRNEGGPDAWGQVTKITASDGAANDEFGYSISISGDTVVVGAHYDDSYSGSVYIFGRNQGGADAWGEVRKITPSDGAASDSFGVSVSISGDNVVVGATGDDDNGSWSGSAYIFGRNQGGADAWGQVAKLTASDGASDDEFGISVSISGDTVVAGAHYDDSYSGSAYIFSRNEGGADAWGQVTKLMASDAASGHNFGISVSISGDTVVAGAWGDNGNGLDLGSAYIFGRNQDGVDAWGQVVKIIASDGASSDYFGYSVSIGGDTVVVGAFGDDDNDLDSGSAYIFGRNHGGADTWGQIAKQVAPGWPVADDGRFGFSVSVSGDIIVVGVWGSSSYPTKPGSAFIFGRNQGAVGAWGQVAQLTAFDGSAGDSFGHSVSIDGDTVVVGARGDDDNGTDSGSAYIFGRNQGGADAWEQVAKIMASDGAEDDFFGKSVSISGDSVVVGAYGDDDNGDFTGSAYIFGRNQGGADAWGQVTKITASDGESQDGLGLSVSISGDTVVVGATGDDDNGSWSGSAYIFERNQGGVDGWGQVSKIMALDGEIGDFFGDSVSISGDTVIVGAHEWHYNPGPGSAYIFDRNLGGADAWGQVTKIAASDGESQDLFGLSVSISGDTVIVGALYDDDNGTSSGSAYIFGRNQGGVDAWGQVTKVTASDGASYDEFGNSVSISGNTVVVGAWASRDDAIDTDSGSAYVFDLGHFIFVDGFESGDTDVWTVTQP